MSVPWNWLGNYTPGIEAVVDSADIGDNTFYPVTWNNAYLTTGDDQICQFEWTVKEVTATVTGSVTMLVYKEDGRGTHDTITQPFSFTSVVANPGTTWDVNEPSDYLSPGVGISFSNGGGQTFPYTFSWGTSADLVISLSGDGGSPAVSLLYGVSGTLKSDGLGFDHYVKSIGIFVFAVVDFGTGLGGGRAMAGNVQSQISAGAVPVGSATFFHGTATIYGEDFFSSPIDGAYTFSAFDLSITDHYTQPPNI